MICLVRVFFLPRGAGGRLVSRLDVACPDFLRMMPCCQCVMTLRLHGLELPKELTLVPWRPITSCLLAVEYGCLEQVLEILNVRNWKRKIFSVIGLKQATPSYPVMANPMHHPCIIIAHCNLGNEASLMGKQGWPQICGSRRS